MPDDPRTGDRIAPTAAPVKPFTPAEKKDIFKAMVVASLDAGFLRYSRRQELLKAAAKLGMGEFEACLLIAEAQFRCDQIDPTQAGEYTPLQDNPVAVGLSTSTLVSLALMAAVLIDLVIVTCIL